MKTNTNMTFAVFRYKISFIPDRKTQDCLSLSQVSEYMHRISRIQHSWRFVICDLHLRMPCPSKPRTTHSKLQILTTSNQCGFPQVQFICWKKARVYYVPMPNLLIYAVLSTEDYVHLSTHIATIEDDRHVRHISLSYISMKPDRSQRTAYKFPKTKTEKGLGMIQIRNFVPIPPPYIVLCAYYLVRYANFKPVKEEGRANAHRYT
jgi:hypothetical protein